MGCGSSRAAGVVSHQHQASVVSLRAERSSLSEDKATDGEGKTQRNATDDGNCELVTDGGGGSGDGCGGDTKPEINAGDDRLAQSVDNDETSVDRHQNDDKGDDNNNHDDNDSSSQAVDWKACRSDDNHDDNDSNPQAVDWKACRSDDDHDIFTLTAVEKVPQYVFDPELNSDLDKAVTALIFNVASEVEKEFQEGDYGGDAIRGGRSDVRGNGDDDEDDDDGTNTNDDDGDDNIDNGFKQSVSCGSDEPLPDLTKLEAQNHRDDITVEVSDGGTGNKATVCCGSDEPLPDLCAVGAQDGVGSGDGDGKDLKAEGGCDGEEDGSRGGGVVGDRKDVQTTESCGRDEPLPGMGTPTVVDENIVGDHHDSGPTAGSGGDGTATIATAGSGGSEDVGDEGKVEEDHDNTNTKPASESVGGNEDEWKRDGEGVLQAWSFGEDVVDGGKEEEDVDCDQPDGLMKALGLSKKSHQEKKVKEAQKKLKKKDNKLSVTSAGSIALEEFPTAPENSAIPLFIYKCVNYIEAERLQTEGLYRISGNKSQGEIFLTQFVEDPNKDINSLGIPVNAIATLIKNFFNELSEPLIPSSVRDELMEAAEMGDKSGRLLMLRGVIKKLPDQNYELLKYVMTHLYRVSQNQEHNNMGSRNLAKCWWPTLLRLEFKSYEKMIQGTQIPEDIVHALIEQAQFFFHGGNEI